MPAINNAHALILLITSEKAHAAYLVGASTRARQRTKRLVKPFIRDKLDGLLGLLRLKAYEMENLVASNEHAEQTLMTTATVA
jgi:hypothetical protein